MQGDPRTTVDGDDLASRCREAILRLIARYGWRAVGAAGLLPRLLAAARRVGPGADLARLALQLACLELYDACRPDQQPARREDGYGDLFAYLYQIAHHRWPDLAEAAAQRAIELTFEQHGRCREPGAFLAFATYKLYQAHTELLRAAGRELPLDEAVAETVADQGADLQLAVEGRERLEALLDGLARLPAPQRQAIFGKFFRGLSDELIAGQLAITPEHVRTLRCRGLRRLRQDAGLRIYLE